MKLNVTEINCVFYYLRTWVFFLVFLTDDEAYMYTRLLR